MSNNEELFDETEYYKDRIEPLAIELRKRLSKLLRYQSTSTKDSEYTSLQNYVDNMKENQEHIYYITGEKRKVLENSPYMEQLRKRDYEVLFMTEPIDEYTLMHLKEFEGKKLVAITSDNLEFKSSDDEKIKQEEDNKNFSDLCSKVKEILIGKVIDVKLSNRVVNTPCCVITDKQGWSATMEKIMKSQALRDNSMMNMYESKKIFELNPNHPTIIGLKEKMDSNDITFKDLVFLLYETSLISAGFTLDNLQEHSTRMFKLVNFGLGVSNEEDETVEETVISEESGQVTEGNVEDVPNESTMEEVD